MKNKYALLGISLGALLISMPAFSQIDTHSQTHAQATETAQQNSLSQTEQRLADLIKAAAAQDLLEVRQSTPGTPTTRQTSTKPSIPVKPKQSCSSEDLFSFPHEAHIDHYESILELKNAMVTGPDQIDMHKAETLAFAYLGLGFTDEALNLIGYLSDEKQAAIEAMAHLVRGTLNGTHRRTIKENASCTNTSQIWQKIAQQKYEAFSPDEYKYLQSLPTKLSEILGIKIATKAIQSGDLDKAQLIYNDIQTRAENHEAYNPDISPYLQNDALNILGASLALKKHDELERNIGIARLKSIAERDGAYRAQALEALVIADKLYPEYMQDLESVTHTFSETPSGKQALAHKISFLADEHQFITAITITKDSFEPESGYYAQSVIVISRKVQIDLSGNDRGLQLGALNALIIEKGFFAHLADAKSLLHAGVSASLNLGLPELAPLVLPVSLWGELDDGTLIILALQEVKPDDFHIPQRIFDSPALKTVKVHRALNNKKPRQAVALLKAQPQSALLQTAFTQAAWDNGYWPLAQDSLRKNSDGQSSNKQDLAATLSVLSPTLINSHRPDGLADQQALQSYLNSDLKIIRSYLLPNINETTGANNG